MEPHQAESRTPFPWRAAAPSLAASGVLLAITICATSVLYVNHRSTMETFDHAAETYRVSIALESIVRELRKQIDHYVDTRDEGDIANFKQFSSALSSAISRFESLTVTPSGRIIVGRPQYTLDLNRALEEFLRGNRQRQSADIQELIDREFSDEALKEAIQQREAAARALEEARATSGRLSRLTIATILILGICGSGVGVLSGYQTARAWQKQIIELSVSVDSATGTLSEVTKVAPIDRPRDATDLTQVQAAAELLSNRVGEVVKRLRNAEQESLRQSQLAALGQLAAGLAHELRNPLTAIQTLVETAQADPDDGALDERDLQVIHQELERLDQTLQAFLDYARPPQLVRRQADIREVVSDTVRLLSARASKQGIQLQTDFAETLGDVEVDPKQIRQVLLNLLLNSLDAIGEEGTVTVSVTPHSETGIQIRVQDDGPGLSPEIQERLFEPFASTKPSGTGLGLTVCRRIIESHGGTITAGNHADGGAEFVITLP
ncbi:MAG: hypothetical protein KDA80_13480 [Planctomycetaceae bacterium]|nr:hypothetical protein [Planctomycetaceae bacterium]